MISASLSARHGERLRSQKLLSIQLSRYASQERPPACPFPPCLPSPPPFPPLPLRLRLRLFPPPAPHALFPFPSFSILLLPPSLSALKAKTLPSLLTLLPSFPSRPSLHRTCNSTVTLRARATCNSLSVLSQVCSPAAWRHPPHRRELQMVPCDRPSTL